MEVGDLSICRIQNQIFDAFDIKSIRIKIESLFYNLSGIRLLF